MRFNKTNTNKTNFLFLWLHCWLLAFFSVSVTAHTDPRQCDYVASLTLPFTSVVTTKAVAAGDYIAPDGKTYPVPAFCRVHLQASPSEDSLIHSEIWLPQTGWNGRYYQLGNVSFSGVIYYSSMVSVLQAGNAVAMTDDGNQSKGLNANWAINHPQKIIDWGYRALKTTSDNARTIIKAFYKAEPSYTYFSGCSTGGRQALVAAQRFPQDWDGVLVGAPASLMHFHGFLSNQQALTATGASYIPPQKLPLIQKFALASCDANARVIDGIASDPRFCRFDPAKLLCKDKDHRTCLTQPQLDALEQIYRGPSHPKTGQLLYPGFESTLEALWDSVIVADDLEKAGQAFFAREVFANLVHENDEWTIQSNSLQDNLTALQERRIQGETLEELLVGSPQPGLSDFQRQGGKLLMYSGWGDAYIAPRYSINYFETMREQIGEEKAQNFFRLLMAPGMGHCQGGPGANAFGQLFGLPSLKDDAHHSIVRALEAWVEKGKAPDHIIATKYRDDKPDAGVLMTRPLCAFPKIAVYQGQGELNTADSFICKEGVQP